MADEESQVCPCEEPAHPRAIHNPPGRDRLSARIGDFRSFRSALLRPLKEPEPERALASWQPTARGDLALQLLEWWAYIADVLAFYDERIANGSYLGTAELPEQVDRIVRALGYRPRPGIAATGRIAALASAAGGTTVPAGFPLQSKPSPGDAPQWFETDAVAAIEAPGVLPLDLLDAASLYGRKSVLLRGRVTSLQPGGIFAIVHRDWSPTVRSNDYAVPTVKEVTVEVDAYGAKNTRVELSKPLTLTSPADSYRALRPEQITQPFTAAEASVVFVSEKREQSAQPAQQTIFPGAKPKAVTVHGVAMHLSRITRGLEPGSDLIVSYPDTARLTRVTGNSEALWYTNATNPLRPDLAPPESEIPQAAPHTVIAIAPPLGTEPDPATVQIRYALRSLGDLMRSPLGVLAAGTTQVTLSPRAKPPAQFAGRDVIVEDALGNGAAGIVESADAGSVVVRFDPPVQVALKAPLRLLYNLVPVSHGQTVRKEVLGSGDASLAGQRFTLQKFPLTYLPGAAPGFAESYHSSLRIWVDGIEWREVPTLFAQPPDARVFVTREDAAQRTTVSFGDGVNGARLPTGIDNVVAAYRFGSGAKAPAPGSLTVPLQAVPGLSALRQPLPIGGGADPDSPEELRRLAPRSVLVFGRAISADDYEVLAAQAPGVIRARAVYAWDEGAQRASVQVYVGDDPAAVDAARTALKAAADPNRPLLVAAAVPKHITLTITLVIDPAYDPEPIEVAIRAALDDPDHGLFGRRALAIGARVYESRLLELCHRQAGVRAVSALQVTGAAFGVNRRLDPGESGFFVLDDLELNTERADAS